MALNDVTFDLGEGGLGRPLPGFDHISAMLFYTGTLPSGFSANKRIVKIFSVEEAENLGVLDDYSDETKATGKYTVTGIGADGDTLNIALSDYTGSIDLGTYTKVVGDADVTAVAAAIVLIINLGTAVHGFTAVSALGVITITARPGLGIYLNTGTPIAVTIVGTMTGTIVQFGAGGTVAGVASLQATYHYHISEYFRIQPQGVLYLCFYAVPATYDFSDLTTIQQFANGEIRKAMVFCDGTTYTSGKVTAAQTICTALAANHMPLSTVLVTFNFAAATLSALTNLAGLASKNVSVVISQDGDGLGAQLYRTVGKSITNIGALLGCASLAKVNEDVAWIQKFNISDGTENNVAAFANGVLFSACSVSLLTILDSYRYIFSIKKVGYEGTFWNDSHTCTLQSSDYAYIENNQTIDKAIRTLYANYLPDLNSPLVVNANGTLKDTTVAYFKNSGDASLDQMVRDGEISAKSINVDPVQNVLTTSQLVISAVLVPVGVARNIVVKIGYSLSI